MLRRPHERGIRFVYLKALFKPDTNPFHVARKYLQPVWPAGESNSDTLEKAINFHNTYRREDRRFNTFKVADVEKLLNVMENLGTLTEESIGSVLGAT